MLWGKRGRNFYSEEQAQLLPRGSRNCAYGRGRADRLEYSPDTTVTSRVKQFRTSLSIIETQAVWHGYGMHDALVHCQRQLHQKHRERLGHQTAHRIPNQ